MSLPDLGTTGKLVWKDFSDKSKWWSFDTSVQDTGCRFEFGGPLGTGAATKRYNFPNTTSPCSVCVNNRDNNFTTNQTTPTLTTDAVIFTGSGQALSHYFEIQSELKFVGAFSANVQYYAQRVGNVVTIGINTMSANGSSLSVLTTVGGQGLQEILWPRQDLVAPAGGGISNGVRGTLVATITAIGDIIIGFEATDGSFTPAGDCGWDLPITFSYTLSVS